MKTVLQFLADEIDTAAQDVADNAAHVAATHGTLESSPDCVKDIRNSAAKLYRLLQIAKNNGFFDTLRGQELAEINRGVDLALFDRAVYEGARGNMTGSLIIV